MSPSTRAWLQIHFCVFLWGFTAILGKLITLPALTLVWWRMVLVTAALLLVAKFWSGLRKMPPRLIAIYAGIGVIVTVHWLTFYGSIKLSNASVAVTCLALTPIFTSFVEPLLGKSRFDARELLFGLAVIPGVVLVVGGTPEGMRLGIVIGILSGVFVAFFSTLNKRYAGDSDALSVTGIEMAAGVILMTAIAPLLPSQEKIFVLPELNDAILLIVLAFGCTLLPFVLALVALRQLSAFTVVLAINMEPVYAVVLAIVLLGEQRELGLSFYMGVAIILLAVFCHPLLMRRSQRSAATLTDGAAGVGQPGRGTSGSA